MTTQWLIVDASLGGIAMGVAEIDAGIPTVTWHAAHTDNGGSMAALAGLYNQALQHAGKAGKAGFAGLVVAVGPGSFTGIKIGIAFASGLIAGSSVPTIGVSGLEAAASYLKQAVLLPSTRTHGFLAEADGTSRLIDTGNAPAPRSPTVGMVGAWPAGLAWLAGCGRAASPLTPAEVSKAAIYGMAQAAARGWPHDFKTLPPAPRYLRLSTAEEQLAQKGMSL